MDFCHNQVPAFSKKFKVFRYDVRGHCQTETSGGDLSMELLRDFAKAAEEKSNGHLKISVFADPEIDAIFPGVKRARVSITTKVGDKHQAQVDHAKGSPQNPMSDEELVAKFMANSEKVIDSKRQKEIVDRTWTFDEINDLEEYMRLFVQNK